MRRRSTLVLPSLLLCAALAAACSDRQPVGSTVAAPGGPRLTVTPTNAFVTFDAGYDHTCGLTSAGQGWCWGRNAGGQLGDSSAASTLVPVSVFQNGVTFAQITAGESHSCALTSAGQAWCWGYNADYRLGDSTTMLRMAPVAVLPLGGVVFASLNAGHFHSCGLNGSGQAYCWGENSYGQLGDSTTTWEESPTAVHQPAGVTFTAVVAGDIHSCALDGGGQAYCWGYGGDGEVGNNSLLGSKYPVAVQQPGGVTFVAISAAHDHSCGVTSGGQAYCWGANGFGQLGDSTVTNRKVPVAVHQPVGVTFAAITTGANHSCGLDGSGQAYCWGSNTYGQLGNASNTASRIPVAVSQPAGVTFTLVSAGRVQTCGLDGGGQTWCWGRNNFGQLGDATSTNRNSPVAVHH